MIFLMNIANIPLKNNYIIIGKYFISFNLNKLILIMK